MPDEPQQNTEENTSGGESTAFYMWLIITASAGIIMAQDTYVGLQQPRLGTMDATAAFTKVLVIHVIWMLVTLGFIGFTWAKRPTSAWKLHIAIGCVTVIWTVGVLISAFTNVERLTVSTWRCTTAPTSSTITEEFLDSCSLADMGSSIRMGGDIFLWSTNDENYWRWIVPGEGRATLQTRWPSQVSAVYLARDTDNAELSMGAEDSVPGGQWSAGFDPAVSRDLNIFYIEGTPVLPIESATPDISFQSTNMRSR